MDSSVIRFCSPLASGNPLTLMLFIRPQLSISSKCRQVSRSSLCGKSQSLIARKYISYCGVLLQCVYSVCHLFKILADCGYFSPTSFLKIIFGWEVTQVFLPLVSGLWTCATSAHVATWNFRREAPRFALGGFLSSDNVVAAPSCGSDRDCFLAIGVPGVPGEAS